MKKYYSILALAMATLLCVPASAQSLKLKGIGHLNRYDDGDQMKSDYLGWDYDLNKAIFVVDNGIYAINYDGIAVATPVKEPEVSPTSVGTDPEKKAWATNFNLMYGNSGAMYFDGQLVTVMSRDEQSTEDDVLFNVRRWDAKTGNLLTTETRPKSNRLESAGMAYNPIDGKIYGLFYLTGQELPDEILEDENYFEEEDDDMTDGDAGYCICTIDLETLEITPITPGLYYYNFITFAINSEGRAFALTSGGSSGYIDDNGKLRNADNKLAGAQLYEFDLKSGTIIQEAIYREEEVTNEETGETTIESYFDYVPMLDGTGYSSQYKRQAACFAKSNPNKMYWIGYVNSGKGINAWGSWSSLDDREWRTNGKYDTALYEVDVNTGEATMLGKVPNRWTFSALWVDGDDASDGAGTNIIPAGISSLGRSHQTDGTWNMAGQHVGSTPQKAGIYLTRQGGRIQKVAVK